jgi:hypothetical protein
LFRPQIRVWVFETEEDPFCFNLISRLKIGFCCFLCWWCWNCKVVVVLLYIWINLLDKNCLLYVILFYFYCLIFNKPMIGWHVSDFGVYSFYPSRWMDSDENIVHAVAGVLSCPGLVPPYHTHAKFGITRVMSHYSLSHYFVIILIQQKKLQIKT